MLLALIGLLLTVIWLLGGVWYVAEVFGFENLLFLLPGELGQFATGFLLPLVLLWLVLGYLHIGQRLHRVEETLWELASLRRPRGGGGSPAPENEGWLDMESGGAVGPGTVSAAPTAGAASAAAQKNLRAVRPAAASHSPPPEPSRASASADGAGGSPFWAERRARSLQAVQPGPQTEPPRRGGLATEIFTSRMRERTAEDRSARRATTPAPAAPPAKTRPAAPLHPVASSRPLTPPSAAQPPTKSSAARSGLAETPPSPRPAPSESKAARPAAQKPVLPKAPLSMPVPPPAATPVPPSAEASVPPRAETPPAATVASGFPPRPEVPPPATPSPEPEAPIAAQATRGTMPDALPRSLPDSAPAQEAASTPEAAADNSTAAEPPAAELPPAVPPVEEPPAEESRAVEPVAAERSAAETPSTEPPSAEPPSTEPAAKPIGFRHLVRITSMELNTIAMDLSGLLCRDADHAQALKGYDKGQKDVFFELLNQQLAKQKPADSLKRLRSAGGDHLMANYLRKFDALVTESKGVDRSGALAKSLEAMPIGRLRSRLQALQAETW